MFWVEGGVLAAWVLRGVLSQDFVQFRPWGWAFGTRRLELIWSTAMPFFAIPSFSRLKISDDARMGGTRGG